MAQVKIVHCTVQCILDTTKSIDEHNVEPIPTSQPTEKCDL